MNWKREFFILAMALAPYCAWAGHHDADHAPAKEIFDERVIPRIQIELSDAAMDRLRQTPRKYLRANIREGDTLYTNVLLRLKGGPGSSRPLDDKPAFTLNFGKEAEGQKFHGLKKLHLNNSVQDRTYLSEKISREFFEAAGVPAPRAGHATVELNGRELGMYVLIEGINKHFLRRYFKDTSGNLYDGHSQNDINRRMRTNSGANRTKYDELSALAAAAAEPDFKVRVARLEKTLDLDRFISFLATEVMISHWDGYTMNRNNFRVFHDAANQRVVFLPQGVDQCFQRPNAPLFPKAVGLVARSVLEVPELRDRYRTRMTQLLTNVYLLNTITNHIVEVAAKVEPVLAEVDPEEGKGYMTKARGFSRRVQQRIRFLEHQLLSPAVVPEFDASGLLSVNGWQPQVDIGSPTLSKQDGEKPGSVLLYIRAQDNTAASWRSRVTLDAGHYRFHGRVQLKGVEFSSQDPKSGVGLRISRQKFSRRLPNETGWTTVAFDFTVAQDHTEVELVCELRATRGEAWFDQGSLRLIRQE